MCFSLLFFQFMICKKDFALISIISQKERKETPRKRPRAPPNSDTKEMKG